MNSAISCKREDNAPVWEHFLWQSSCVWKRFSFPPQPPYTNSLHVWFWLSKYHWLTYDEHGPGPGGNRQTSAHHNISSFTCSCTHDWLIEQGLTSPPTQYRLSGRQFYRWKDPKPTASKYWRKSWPATDRKRLQTHQGPPTVYTRSNMHFNS